MHEENCDKEEKGKEVMMTDKLNGETVVIDRDEKVCANVDVDELREERCDEDTWGQETTTGEIIGGRSGDRQRREERVRTRGDGQVVRESCGNDAMNNKMKSVCVSVEMKKLCEEGCGNYVGNKDEERARHRVCVGGGGVCVCVCM